VWLNVFWSKTIWLAFPDAKVLFQMSLFNKIDEINEIFCEGCNAREADPTHLLLNLHQKKKKKYKQKYTSLYTCLASN
jgi:hypothetical protein